MWVRVDRPFAIKEFIQRTKSQQSICYLFHLQFSFLDKNPSNREVSQLSSLFAISSQSFFTKQRKILKFSWQNDEMYISFSSFPDRFFVLQLLEK